MADNHLYYGDNPDILQRYIATETVDLVYLDPPFNSNQTYNVLFAEKSGEASAAQIHAFEDTWHWDQAAARAYDGVALQGGQVSQAMLAFKRMLGENDMLAYLAMMAPRLVELHRVLKSTGSIYLHCDPTASHYLKMLMDAIFGQKNYQSEIVWKRTSAHNSGRKFGPVHDIILFYSKGATYTWNNPQRAFDESYIDSHYANVENGRRYKRQDVTGAGVRHGETGKPWHGIDPTLKGRHWMRPPTDLDALDAQGLIYWPNKKGAWPYLKLFLDERSGMPVQDVWEDIDPVNPVAKERLGYPTQKPLALLERIITASSNEDDVVLDPFCGCGTAVVSAQKSKRHWIGIDITHLAIGLMKNRLEDAFEDRVSYTVIGEPVDSRGAEALAKQDPYQFQWWALYLVGGRPDQQRKGADRGIDGRILFQDDATREIKQAIISVKSGTLKPDDIRALGHVVTREDAHMGVLITMQEATQPMRADAASGGFYRSPAYGNFPRLQIITVKELLDGKRIDMPPLRQTSVTFRRAPKAKAAIVAETRSIWDPEGTSVDDDQDEMVEMDDIDEAGA